MRLSCCAYSYRQALQAGSMSLEQFVTTCRDLGLTGVELTSYYFPSTDRSYLNRLKRHCHASGISVSGCAVGTDFAASDEAVRAKHLETTLAWLEHCVALGAPTLRVFAGYVRPGEDAQAARRHVVECLQTCAPTAEACGVVLALENHGGLTATPEQTVALLDAVDHDWVCLNLDCGNFGGDFYAGFEQCAPYAVACHAKVHAQPEPSGLRPEVDYRRVRRILEEAGYRGWLAIEYEEEAPAESGVPSFAASLQAALN
ncbi:MAG: sugar phosphate isomerase/epimerase [Armatimonadetes bacterium]|nr:sugar phosphate isomerase/epimerase [Armatimonadota bacterium]MDE2205119.1 sugar phosphate isomerase/epimerase [Armatimonadota bacterium]